MFDYIARVHNEAMFTEAFSLHKAFTLYDGVKLMASAWDMAPKSVVLNGCLKAGILSSFQKFELLGLLRKTSTAGEVKRAQKPFVGSLFEGNRIMAETKAGDAKKRRKEYVNSKGGNDCAVDKLLVVSCPLIYTLS